MYLASGKAAAWCTTSAFAAGTAKIKRYAIRFAEVPSSAPPLLRCPSLPPVAASNLVRERQKQLLASADCHPLEIPTNDTFRPPPVPFFVPKPASSPPAHPIANDLTRSCPAFTRSYSPIVSALSKEQIRWSISYITASDCPRSTRYPFFSYTSLLSTIYWALSRTNPHPQATLTRRPWY
jgi:hypothetical protein